jgi:hypothetical protein
MRFLKSVLDKLQIFLRFLTRIYTERTTCALHISTYAEMSLGEKYNFTHAQIRDYTHVKGIGEILCLTPVLS